MDRLVPMHADTRIAFGPGRGGAPDGGGHRGTGAGFAGAGEGPDGRGHQDAFARVLAATCVGAERATASGLPGAKLAVATLLGAARAGGRFDEPRIGRSSAGSGTAAPAAASVGRRVDIAA